MIFHDGYDWDVDGYPGEYVYGEYVYVSDYYMDERWKPIKSFPDYWISNKARVWSCSSGRFLTVKPMDRHGHLGVCLCMNGKQYYKYIHRLMAEAFIPNPDNHPIVRHWDDDPSYNVIENLSWGTQKDNMHDAVRNGHYYSFTDEDREKQCEMSRIPVVAVNLKTGEEMRFRSQTEAGRFLNIPQANVWKVLNGQRPHAKGFYFEYLPREDYR